MRGSTNTRNICTALRKIGIKTIHINVTHSIFEWENKERDITEDRIDFQVSEEKLNEAIATIKLHHIYKLPAITWQEIHGTDETIEWLNNTSFNTTNTNINKIADLPQKTQNDLNEYVRLIETILPEVKNKVHKGINDKRFNIDGSIYILKQAKRNTKFVLEKIETILSIIEKYKGNQNE